MAKSKKRVTQPTRAPRPNPPTPRPAPPQSPRVVERVPADETVALPTLVFGPREHAPRAVASPTLRELFTGITLETALYAFIFAVALVLRLSNLGARPLSEQEAATALGAFQFLQGQGSGITASPFLFTSNLLSFVLLTASELSARLVPALIGSVLVLLPVLLRREIGRAGALLASALLLLSASLVYYARDVNGIEISAVCGLAALLLLWRAGDPRRAREVYWAAVLGAIALTASAAGFTLLLAGIIAWLFTRWLSSRANLDELAPEGTYSNGPIGGTLPLVDIGAEAVAEPRADWARALLIFSAAYVAAATGFFMNRAGLGAAFNLAGDWLNAFSSVGPLNSPLSLLLIYEPLAVVFGFAGLILVVSSRGVGVRERGGLLLCSTVTIVALLVYSISGRKDPANAVVIAIPLTILAGWFLGNLLERAGEDIGNAGGVRSFIWGELPILVMALVLVSVTFLQLASFFQQNRFSPGIQSFYELVARGAPGPGAAAIVLGVICLVVVLFIALLAVGSLGGTRAANLGAIAVAILLLLLGVRALWLANFSGQDTTHELLSPDQSSLQVRDLVRDLEQASQWRANDPHVMSVRVEGELGAVVQWNLRRFVNVSTGQPTKVSGEAQALLTDADAPAPAGNWESQRYRVTMNWQPQRLAGAELWKWLLFRQGGSENWQQVKLWVPKPQ